MISADAAHVEFDDIESTNGEALRRARSGDFGPVWLRAERQSAGRGRRGSAWISAPGNLFLTYLGPATAPPARLALLSFAAALSVADLVDDAVGRPVARVKWPNDVLVEGGKVSGILIESGVDWVAIGIGVNLATSPETLDRPVRALATFAGRPIAPRAAALELELRLVHWGGRLEREGFEPLRDAWMARAAGLGDPCTARLGSEDVAGTLVGLDHDGALALRLPDGQIRRITAGEVFIGLEGAH